MRALLDAAAKLRKAQERALAEAIRIRCARLRRRSGRRVRDLAHEPRGSSSRPVALRVALFWSGSVRHSVRPRSQIRPATP